MSELDTAERGDGEDKFNCRKMECLGYLMALPQSLCNVLITVSFN